MLVRSLFTQVAALPGERSDYSIYLAAPDTVEGDTVDVQLVPAVRVDWDDELKTIRLYPELPDSDDDTIEDVDSLMANMPLEEAVPQDARLQVQVPLVRTGPGYYHLDFVDVTEAVIGTASKEIWLLTKARSEFPPDELPT